MAYKNIAELVLQEIIVLAFKEKHPRRPRDCFGNKNLNFTIHNKDQIISALNEALTKRLQDKKQYTADSGWDCSWWNCCWCPNSATENFIDNFATQLYKKLPAHLTADLNKGIKFYNGTVTFPPQLFSEFNILKIIDELLNINPENIPLLTTNNIQMTDCKM